MGDTLPEDFVPNVFYKGSRDTVIGPSQAIVLSSGHVDWEAELAAVIGRTARNVPVQTALDHVAGYTCHNDVTDRDALLRPDGSLDLLAGKGRDSFAPLGPYLVPRYLVPQPEGLRVRCLVNGEVRQEYSMSEMYWSVARCVSYLSTIVTLQPGDVVGLGTGAGTGWASGAPEPRSLEGIIGHMRAGGGAFLKAGDRVAVEVEGVGVLENEVA
jgi:2-keto-4-pentenoate hydratase/2-oxohepta-3-ene-1,7-dioic acid hydratase in catechol pathway